MGFWIATAGGTDVIAYLSASVNFTTLLTSKPKAWQTSFTTDKSSKNVLLSSTNVSRRKASKCLFQLPLDEKDHQQLLYQFLDLVKCLHLLMFAAANM